MVGDRSERVGAFEADADLLALVQRVERENPPDRLNDEPDEVGSIPDVTTVEQVGAPDGEAPGAEGEEPLDPDQLDVGDEFSGDPTTSDVATDGEAPPPAEEAAVHEQRGRRRRDRGERHERRT